MPRAKRREPCIYPLPNGKFRVQVQRGDIVHVARADTEDAAIEIRDAFRLDGSLRKYGLPGLIRREPALLALIDAFLDAPHLRDLAPATVDHYRYCLAGFRVFLRDEARNEAITAAAFDDLLVGRYRRWRTSRRLTEKARKIPSDVQVSKDLTILAMVYRYARVAQPWRMPRRIQRNLGGKRIPALEQFLAFLEAMPEGSLERTFAECLANTGMRPIDARLLR